MLIEAQQREKIEKMKALLESIANEIAECQKILKGEVPA